VKLATHKNSKIVRASKLIPKKMVEKLGSWKKDRLFEEVEILMETDHPNILKLFHLYED
jgi:serine/threonine protein kinase